jgi:hypothetical protein
MIEVDASELKIVKTSKLQALQQSNLKVLGLPKIVHRMRKIKIT